MTIEATAIILAGGSSRRMGRDKAGLLLEGRTLLERVVALMAAFSPDVVIAGGAARAPLTLTARSVEDPPGSAGPLAGIVAGLSAARFPIAVVVACDMPFVSAPLLEHLVSDLHGHDAAVPVLDARPQPLHAAYSTDCLKKTAGLWKAGPPSMHEFLESLRVNYVPEEKCRKFDPRGLSAFNVNTPEDYRRACRLLGRDGVSQAA